HDVQRNCAGVAESQTVTDLISNAVGTGETVVRFVDERVILKEIPKRSVCCLRDRDNPQGIAFRVGIVQCQWSIAAAIQDPMKNVTISHRVRRGILNIESYGDVDAIPV